MPPFKWILRSGVLFDPELCWLKSIEGVAGGAIASVGALGELPAVWVRLVAVGAFLVCDRLLEIPPRVTLAAAHLGMLAEQREMCLRVIEFCLHLHLFPRA